MSKLSIEDAKAKIENAILQDGPYSNNVVGSVLRCVAQEHGIKEANNLVDEYDIDELYGIEKVDEDEEIVIDDGHDETM